MLYLRTAVAYLYAYLPTYYLLDIVRLAKYTLGALLCCAVRLRLSIYGCIAQMEWNLIRLSV
jgi:hypothetical protein